MQTWMLYAWLGVYACVTLGLFVGYALWPEGTSTEGERQRMGRWYVICLLTGWAWPVALPVVLVWWWAAVTYSAVRACWISWKVFSAEYEREAAEAKRRGAPEPW